MKIKQKPRLQNMFTCFVNLTYFLYPYANLKKNYNKYTINHSKTSQCDQIILTHIKTYINRTWSCAKEFGLLLIIQMVEQQMWHCLLNTYIIAATKLGISSHGVDAHPQNIINLCWEYKITLVIWSFIFQFKKEISVFSQQSRFQYFISNIKMHVFACVLAVRITLFVALSLHSLLLCYLFLFYCNSWRCDTSMYLQHPLNSRPFCCSLQSGGHTGIFQ